jgi:DNA polymerase III delta prime subunit
MPERKLSDWMAAYGEYTAQSDSPQIFHMWCGLGTIAGAAQRKIFMRNKYFYVHTNMYVILVSPPGVGKKTTALRMAKDLLAEVEPKVNFVTESGSFEGLVGSMSKISNPAHQSMTLYSMELGTLMSTNPAVMIDFLTDIYDGNPDWSRQTVKHNVQTIKKPWLNIMAGTTPKWLGEHIGLIALEGGLISRTLMPYSEEMILDNSWPESDRDSNPLLRAELIHDLSIIATIEGQFQFAGGRQGEAFRWYDEWYRDRSRFPAISDPRTASYYSRKHIHILRVAMAVSLSQSNKLELELPDLLIAKQFLDATEAGMRLALNAVGKNETSGEGFHVLSQIAARKRVGYRELLIANYHNLGKKGLDTILDELRSMGKIKAEGADWVAL